MKKFILFITLFFIAISTVYAEEVTLTQETIEDTYTYYYDKNEGRERYLYAKKNFFGDTTAYCLELGKDISSKIYTYTTSFEEMNIGRGALDYIKLIAYYGYDYPGHNTDEYYMITQELIWNRMSNINVSWVLNMTPGKEIDLTEEEKTIVGLFNTHYWKPSFDGEEIEFIPGEELVLEDTNKVLERYTTTSDNVVIEGNKLIIKENFSGEEIVFTKRNYTGKSYLLYTSGLSQKLMSTGVVDNVTSTIKVNIIKGSLEVTKLDKYTNDTTAQGEATLEGAIYELYDKNNNLVDTIITGTKNKIDNLPIGEYTLKEKIPSKGYLLDENNYTIKINKDNLDVKLNVYEEVIKRKVEIFKVFASNTTGELTPEPNIKFEIYDNKNNLIDKVTTDSEGYASITLPYGTYTFKQINSTENYYKVNDFNVEISEYNERPIYKLLSNSEITAKVKIIKKDLDTKEKIIGSNIKFKIFDVKNNKYLSLKVSYPENKETTEFQVDKNGIFITPIALSSGEYILEELKEPMDGYLYNNQKIPFSIGQSSSFILEDDELYLEIPFYNKRVKGAVNIIKYGEEIKCIDNTYYFKEIPLEKVTFNLYASKDIYENGKLIYKQDQIVKELITNKEGKITESNLPLGKYYLKEVSTTNGHILDENVYEIDLSYKDENTEVVTHTLKLNNYLSKGNLIINKYETGTKTPIPNTLIEVHTKDNKIIYKGYTNDQGQILIEDIPYGEYYLSEVEASTGYRLLEDNISFEINKDEEIINIYNERLFVPNTGLKLSTIDIFVIVISILSLLLIFFFPRDKRVVFTSIIITLLGITYFIIIIYKYYDDKVSNEQSVEAYINNTIETVEEEKYQYKSILEIPSINLKRGILDIENEYNTAKYNIELIKEDNNTIILAAHNGNNQNSFFGQLHTIQLGDQINYYQNGTLYKYIYSESYDIKKDGYADIYRKDDQKSIILITCKDNTDDAQTVYMGYLKEITTY